ncbi:CDP-glycerol glycerophosphotransferase family protein [Demequina sp. NBRC 110051]|uniref:CDP-glycerol glycerophosphotransferase family protein n=1 Tax=Demequina sp. NBRC 110051 TaxID=1570340 RepID=UPI0013563F0D|nr:CDP-glycerol glycerophosphotransferase family protein [Demequina sp. NBRC 110051]
MADLRAPRVPGADLVVSRDPAGRRSMTRVEGRCAIDSISISEGERALVIEGRWRGRTPRALVLRGARVDTRADLTMLEDSRFECRLPLHAEGWLGQDRVVPCGTYVIQVDDGRSAARMVVAPASLRQTLPIKHQAPFAHIKVGRAALGQITVTLAPPLTSEESGVQGRAAVTSVKRPTPVVKDAVFLQSWFGKTFSDSPAPLADALRHHCREVLVGVRDFSVEVPDHVTPVIVGSRAWWEAMTSARVVVDNSWTPKEFKRRPGQKVVQTWHGTPLKKLGYDRSQHEGRPSTPQSFRWGSSKWDLLVSPNDYSTEILRRAYTYDGEIAQVGYPRNDVLVADDGVRSRVRASLGIAADTVVVVYAPTFRESQQGRSVFCDVEALGRALGPGFQLLVRGHSAALRPGTHHHGSHALDVSTYPESSHILAVADVLVTDYSSVMFDFTATGRPVVFFTPDMDAYAQDGRGVYFDLESTAPGPVVRRESQLAYEVRRAWRERAAVSPRYETWRTRYNGHDDGGATERLASRIREWL